MIIGCPGSGKSTLARTLRDMTGLPLFYLDMLYWNGDRTTVSKENFLERLNEVIAGDRWIIDGNYGSTMEMRMQACDTVIFLDYPVEVCLEGVRQRRGKPREDIPWVETEEDQEFLQFIRDYGRDSRPKVLALLEAYTDKQTVILHSREEAAEYLRSLH
jgi:adenylate kinase family enzyme